MSDQPPKVTDAEFEVVRGPDQPPAPVSRTAMPAWERIFVAGFILAGLFILLVLANLYFRPVVERIVP